MRKSKLLTVLSMLLLSSCNFFNKEFSIKVKYRKKGDTTEYEIGETIKYGESFNFDKFLLYKQQDGKTTLLNESSYTVSFSGGQGLSEEIFKSSMPEVGDYSFSFEHKANGKTRSTGISFRVNYGTQFPSNVSLTMEDWDFFGEKKTPTINNYTPTLNASVEYYIFNISNNEYYGKIDLNDGQRVMLEPGRYRMTASVYDNHYSEAMVSCEFNINKIDFPEDILEVYKTYYNFTFMIGYKTIEEYDVGDAKVRYKSSQQEFVLDRTVSSLSWKDKNKAISTSENTTHTVVLHSAYFNDYEYEVEVRVNKLEVDEPGGLYIDEWDYMIGNTIKYDGNEHTAHVVDLAFFGQYRVNEELSTLKATEKGTYTVVVELVDKDNLLWKKTHNNVDLSFTWLIW